MVAISLKVLSNRSDRPDKRTSGLSGLRLSHRAEDGAIGHGRPGGCGKCNRGVPRFARAYSLYFMECALDSQRA